MLVPNRYDRLPVRGAIADAKMSSFAEKMSSFAEKMSSFAEMPLHRVRARCEQLACELKKSPDFQLYLLAQSPHDRARMERLLLEIPAFRLWHKLSNSIGPAYSRLAGSTSTATVEAPNNVVTLG
jgi:hypothetical protein